MPCRLQEGPFDEHTFVTVLVAGMSASAPTAAVCSASLATSLIERAGMSLVTLSYSGRVLSLKNMSASAPGCPNHFTYKRWNSSDPKNWLKA